MNDVQRAEGATGIPDDHFILQMGLVIRREGDAIVGEASVHPRLCAEGTRRLRMAVLATWVDVVAGHVPGGMPHTPTVDLCVQRIASIPEQGVVTLEGRADRTGRRLIVSDTRIRDASGRTFARATATFVNHPLATSAIDVRKRPAPCVDSIDRFVGATVTAPGVLELLPRDALANGAVGTVQGGVQALVAEMAAEHLVGAGSAVCDLDLRYLSFVKRGPLRATAELLAEEGDGAAVRVRLTDAGDDQRLVSVASATVKRG
jgi:acyl-coenzyme A thioesterase PaaI-like protein